MDYDDDGVLDIISGSYSPGDVYLIRGLGDGNYAAVESITDEEDTPLVHHPKEMKRHLDGSNEQSDELASFGSWVTPMDWDADGDLDMLIGSFGGQIFLRKNVGTRKAPRYDSSSTQVIADGKPLKVHSHASPVAVDWNDDGLEDLVVGEGNGSVGWYQNIGTSKEPEFGARRLLVGAPSDSIFLMQYLDPDEISVPGTRAQVCVYDYNGDGRLDLLVGDYSTRIEIDDDWSDDKKAGLFAAFHQSAVGMKRYSAMQKDFAERHIVALESGPEAVEALNLEFQKESEKLQKRNEKDFEPMGKKNMEVVDQLFMESPSVSKVWLYLRKPK